MQPQTSAVSTLRAISANVHTSETPSRCYPKDTLGESLANERYNGNETRDYIHPTLLYSPPAEPALLALGIQYRVP